MMEKNPPPLTREQACILSAYTRTMLIDLPSYLRFWSGVLGRETVLFDLMAGDAADEIRRIARPLALSMMPLPKGSALEAEIAAENHIKEVVHHDH